MPAYQTILIFVGAPIGLFVLISGIVWAASAPKGGGSSALEGPDRF